MYGGTGGVGGGGGGGGGANSNAWPHGCGTNQCKAQVIKVFLIPGVLYRKLELF